MLELVAPFLIAAVGALVVWYADACRRGTVRRQRILGYRTALTMRDPKAWITVHRATAPMFYLAGGGAVLAGLAGGGLAMLGITAAVPFVLGERSSGCSCGRCSPPFRGQPPRETTGGWAIRRRRSAVLGDARTVTRATIALGRHKAALSDTGSPGGDTVCHRKDRAAAWR
ncbi:hypothetical protein GLO27_19155 [Microbacterium sp. Be9]|nr:hypothetical protein [Microbacterium sp. Be9]